MTGGIVVDINEFATDPRINAVVRANVIKAFQLDEEMTVEIDCPWSQYVEFGSDPYPNPGNKTPHITDPICGDDVTETNLRIRDWYTRKHLATPEDRKKLGDRLYKKIMDEGMQANPFIRPAKYVVTEDIKVHPEKYFKPDSNATELIAQELKTQMMNALLSNESVDTGELLRSIRVVKTAEVEGKVPPEDLKKIKPEIWDDQHLDRHGNMIKPKGR